MRTATRPSLLLLAIIYLAFVSLGLPDSILGVAWPTVRANLSLPLETAGLLTLIGTLLSAASGFSSGVLTRRFGTGPIVLVSGLATASGLLLFSGAPSLAFLVLAGIPLGLGAGGVDSSLNAYVAKHYSARHMNWLHSFWGVGATVGPVVMTLAIGTASGWRAGYLWISITQFVLAALFLATIGLWKRNEGLSEDHSHAENGPTGTLAAKSPAAWISVATYMVYVTLEASTGLWANTVLVSSRGVPAETGGLWIAAYYGSIMSGRVLTGFVVGRWGNRRMVALGLSLALVGAILFFVPYVSPWVGAMFGGPTSWLPLVGLILLGLGFAPVYPCLMHETPRRFLPDAAPVVIGRQVGASYIAGAFFPGLLGWAMAHTSVEVLSPFLAIMIVVLLVLVGRLNTLSRNERKFPLEKVDFSARL